MIGIGRKAELLTVVHALREEGTVIRIISARRSTRNESRQFYERRLKKQVTINIDADVIDYFKRQSSESGIPYQTLINLYLVECMKENRKLSVKWE